MTTPDTSKCILWYNKSLHSKQGLAAGCKLDNPVLHNDKLKADTMQRIR